MELKPNLWKDLGLAAIVLIVPYGIETKVQLTHCVLCRGVNCTLWN